MNIFLTLPFQFSWLHIDLNFGKVEVLPKLSQSHAGVEALDAASRQTAA